MSFYFGIGQPPRDSVASPSLPSRRFQRLSGGSGQRGIDHQCAQMPSCCRTTGFYQWQR